ncbi:MAG: hypothetical protein IPH07_19820 [Deltaproteobacteria bacterium]|nr:hypothetical protein [Deltaproteobacteria bacterium]MBK8240055.1 hypothetical protein [Deltaproteobacteria bacterium]MBK8715954.1 hypothetical protein [Deltaproteobacteria bacterium]MBP7291864.1 hypothetical protein [Nannocystaceae bacterium]
MWWWILGPVVACGPTAASTAGDGSGDGGASSTTTERSDTSTDEGDSTTAAPVPCTSEALDDLDLVRTAGMSEVAGALEVVLANSPSHECGGLACDDGWQVRVRVDPAASGPQALGTIVWARSTVQSSDCQGPGEAEPCECPEPLDHDSGWTGTVEIVAQDDACMQLRFVDTNVLGHVNEPSPPTTFGAVASRCN